MATGTDRREVATLDEIVRAQAFEEAAPVAVLERKGVVTRGDLLAR